MRSVLLLAVLLAGCAAPTPSPPDVDAVAAEGGGPLALASAAFADGAAIPRKHTCDGENVSPPLAISGVPANATTLAMIVGDGDAPLPQAPQRNVTHWLLWDVAAAANVTFPEDGVPPGTVENETGWRGPCPPLGSAAHRYVFTLFAVDGALGLPPATSRPDLEAALDGRVLETTILTGTYARALPVGRS